jgi:transposase
MVRRQRFNKEFKLEAVRLLDLGQKSPTQLALELGVRRNQLYKWKEQLTGKGDGAFRGPGRKPAASEGEVARLKHELAKVT